MTFDPFESSKPRGLAVALGAVATIAAADLTSRLLSNIAPIVAWGHDAPYTLTIASLTAWIADTVVSAFRTASKATWVPSVHNVVSLATNDIWQGLLYNDLVPSVAAHALACAAVGLTAGFVGCKAVLRATLPRDGLKHVKGRQLFIGRAARCFANKAMKKAIKATGKGLLLAPGVQISADRETRHFMLLGGIGSGKSVVIWHLLLQILARDRGDKTIIHDSKGDFLSKIPDGFALLAVHDRRSVAWDIAKDILTPQDCRELAKAMIPESSDPMWGKAAREIMTGVLISLLIEKGDSWGWGDFATGLFLPAEELRALLEQYYQPAVEYVAVNEEGTVNKTTISLLVTMRAAMAAIVLPFAEAWSDANPSRRFSVRAWIQDPNPTNMTLVLQRAAHLPELSQAFAAAFIRTFANIAVGPDLPDNAKRRIWLLMDELAQAGHIPGFSQLIEVGRSKGVCCVLGFQDQAQIEEHYGPHVAKTWLSNVGTKIIGRMEGSPSATEVCEVLIGKRLVSWIDETESGGKALAPHPQSETVSKHIQRDTVPVILPDYLDRNLGRQDRFLHARIASLVLGVGGDVLQFEWPVVPMPTLRPATIPADWLRARPASPAAKPSPRAANG